MSFFGEMACRSVESKYSHRNRGFPYYTGRGSSAPLRGIYSLDRHPLMGYSIVLVNGSSIKGWPFIKAAINNEESGRKDEESPIANWAVRLGSR